MDAPLLVVVADPREAGPRLRAAIAACTAELLVSGVGKIAATLAVSRRLSLTPVRALMLAGVAGAWREQNWAIGDLAWVESTWLADEGVETPQGWRSIAALGLGSIGPFKSTFTDDLARGRQAVVARSAEVATVSTCSGTDELADRRAAIRAFDLETMESAAVAAVCQTFACPWLELRAVSNYTGKRDAAAWDLQRAIAALDDAAALVVQALTDEGRR